MSYHKKLYEGLKKFKEAKEVCKKNAAAPNPGTAADFWKQHAEFYADLCDMKDEKIKELEQKLKKQKEYLRFLTLAGTRPLSMENLILTAKSGLMNMLNLRN